MNVVWTREQLDEGVKRLATQLVTMLASVPRWALVGIRDGGVPLADELADEVERQGAPRPDRGDVDITLYRDDLYTGLEKPVLGDTDLPFPVTGCGIVLVDDVLFTGRTVRAAMGEVWDFGRPDFIKLVVLVDRGHRELPVAADLAALALDTRKSDRVTVDWERREVRVEPGAG
ncbi:MAG: bifunctional pyr operon transcriptional regulator/uracil phosphoribosyltransferase PyrR [Deltaproteobacteria bacterium]|nr:bifunctional pyr operon transcriptional regulator/uracil phosphoribosyltransferase PyrR [Deltaproteobacteria bacterium]